MKGSGCVLLLGILAGCGGPSSPGAARPSESVGPPLLWRISKGGSVSHLLAMPPAGVRIEELPPLIWQTMERSRLVVVEYDGTRIPRSALDEVANLPDGKRLPAMLEVDEVAALVLEIGGSGDGADIVHRRPGWLATQVAAGWAMDEDNHTRFAARAKTRNKPVRPLMIDVVKESAEFFAAHGLGHLRAVLQDVPGWRDRVQRAMSGYRAGDVPALRKLANSAARGAEHPEAVRAWYAQGGGIWLDRIAADLAKGGLFIAIDVEEALNDRGMLAGLRARGYRVERLGVGQAATVAGAANARPTPALCRDQMKRAARTAKAAPGVERSLVVFCLENLRPAAATCFGEADSVAELEACGEDAWPLLALAGVKTDWVRHMKTLSERACDCAHAGCGRDVLADFQQFVRLNKDDRIPDEEAEKARKLAEKVGECIATSGVSSDEIDAALEEIGIED